MALLNWDVGQLFMSLLQIALDCMFECIFGACGTCTHGLFYLAVDSWARCIECPKCSSTHVQKQSLPSHMQVILVENFDLRVSVQVLVLQYVK